MGRECGCFLRYPPLRKRASVVLHVGCTYWVPLILILLMEQLCPLVTMIIYLVVRSLCYYIVRGARQGLQQSDLDVRFCMLCEAAGA